MDRYRQMLHQSDALRQVIKQAYGVEASVTYTQPFHNIGEVSITCIGIITRCYGAHSLLRSDSETLKGVRPSASFADVADKRTLKGVPPSDHSVTPARKACVSLPRTDTAIDRRLSPLKVFVIDTNKQPLQPCHPARARQLLQKGKAAVYRRYPFTIILKREIVDVDKQPRGAIARNTAQRLPRLRLKIDPGSKTAMNEVNRRSGSSGFAIVNDNTGDVVFAAELEHRGQKIKKSMDSRRSIRRSRRSRKTRYRKPRFNNRTCSKGWLPPSLMSRVFNIETWVARLRRYCPITAISLELVRFDTQAMVNPEISGVEYQQGELQGYEVREYLLEKFGRKCVYCGAENVPLQVEHIRPKTRGGSNRVSNLT